jgi:Ti-type conjugative transfer relaxase TraA
MMSLRALGNLSAKSLSAKEASRYYNEVSEEYYAKNSEEKQGGKWIGTGAKLQGLTGPVTQEQLQLALAGYSAGQEVQNAGKADRQMGWDMTFSAPKSVSILWALSDNDQRQRIEEAHQKALESAYKYLESKIQTRRGSLGKIKEPAHTIAASYTHYTSRSKDPQLHSHVVVSNFCVRPDKSVGTIESKPFYEYRIASGTLYQTELAYYLRSLGYEVEPDKKGTFRLKEIDHRLEKLFSKRDNQIDKITEAQGITTYAGTRKVVISTRPNKTPTNLSQQQDHWHNEINEAGLSAAVPAIRKPLAIENIDQKAIVEAASAKIIKNTSVFKEKDAIKAIAANSIGKLTGREVEKIFLNAQRDNQIISLGKDKSQNAVYSTPEMIALEKRMLEKVETLAAKNNYGVDSSSAIKNQPHLSPEQKSSIEAATAESGLAVIQGRAGTGKTTMLSAVKESYKTAGWQVKGLAFTGQAAQNMQKETGIKSRTIASWQNEQTIEPKTILIVDEAGMIGSRQMADILERADKYQAKVILVGDQRQLQPIEAGSALKAVDERLSRINPEFSSRMEDIKRQNQDWMREVVREAAQGNTREALFALDQRGRIKIYDYPSGARKQLIDDYLKENISRQKDALILTNHKSDAAKINQEIRQILQQEGLVGENKAEVDNGSRKIALAQGDRIMLTRNDYHIDVRNGQRGAIKEINAQTQSIKVELDNNETKTIPLDHYNHIDYGWASTTHKAQGATTEKTYVYGHTQEPMASQQSTYVQISRAREETKLYLVKGEKAIERPWQKEKESENSSLITDEKRHQNAIKEVTKSWSKDSAKETTADYFQQGHPRQTPSQEREM